MPRPSNGSLHWPPVPALQRAQGTRPDQPPRPLPWKRRSHLQYRDVPTCDQAEQRPHRRLRRHDAHPCRPGRVLLQPWWSWGRRQYNCHKASARQRHRPQPVLLPQYAPVMARRTHCPQLQHPQDRVQHSLQKQVRDLNHRPPRYRPYPHVDHQLPQLHDQFRLQRAAYRDARRPCPQSFLRWCFQAN